jgi:diphthamide synthase (EF-2-diphthine--ammonia ligase)
MVPAVAFWSGGKDSGLALDRVRRRGAYEVRALAQEFIDRRFKAIICCTNDAHLTQSAVRRPLDAVGYRLMCSTYLAQDSFAT